MKDTKGLIFNIQGYSIHDGPGIRTTVFMKGCPLKCIWCSNPESQHSYPEIFYSRVKCVRCYRCIKICSHGAIKITEEGDFPEINREQCINCIDRACVGADGCYEEALESVGYYITVDELIDEICKDIPFYKKSGGGVTFSGGEATKQPEFLLEALMKCRQKGIHTNLDTCGYVPWEMLSEMLGYLNLIFYDIKVIDDDKHKEFTGLSNKLILENVERIVAYGKTPLRLRMPIIPGYNTSPKDLGDFILFAKGLGIRSVDLLPYHGMGAIKYDKLGLTYKLKDLKASSKEEMEEIQNIFAAKGLSCLIK